MVGTPKKTKVGYDFEGLPLIRPRLQTTTLLNSGELGYDVSGYIKWHDGSFERILGGTSLNALRLDELKVPSFNVSMNSKRLTNLADGVNPQDAVTKSQLDYAISGLDPKKECRVTTTTHLTGAIYNPVGGTNATGGFTNAPTILDGITLNNDDRILVRNQIDPKENGIYRQVSATVWERASDHDGTPNNEVSGGNYVLVIEGTTKAGTSWYLQGYGNLILNTDDLIWVQFYGNGTIIAGNGLLQTGNVFDIQTANTGIIVNPDNIELNLATPSGLAISSGLMINDSIAGNGLSILGKVLNVGTTTNSGIIVNTNDIAIDSNLIVRKVIDTTTIVGDNTTTDFEVTHNLFNQWVFAQLINNTTLVEDEAEIERTSNIKVTVKFAQPLLIGQSYTITILG